MEIKGIRLNGDFLHSPSKVNDIILMKLCHFVLSFLDLEIYSRIKKVMSLVLFNNNINYTSNNQRSGECVR